jgi:hypothetical protein
MYQAITAMIGITMTAATLANQTLTPDTGPQCGRSGSGVTASGASETTSRNEGAFAND